MDDVLFLAQRIPYPPDKGDKLRSFQFLRHLAEGRRVHLGCFVDDPADWARAGELKKLLSSHCLLPLDRRLATLRSAAGLLTGEPLGLPFYRDARLHRWVAEVMARDRPGLVYAFSSQVAQYIPDGPKAVMDFCDVDSRKWAQYAEKRRPPMRWLYRREADRLLAYERRVAGRVSASLFVSAAERDLFRSLAPEHAGKVHALENGIDAAFFSPEPGFERPFPAGGRAAVFTGAMDYWPNVEAVQWFTANVLPLLPGWRLMIVGSNPAPAVAALAGERVTVTGRVPDVRPWLAHADAVVAPLLTARGIQNKVLEGMAMARPVVASPEAHEGIDAELGVHLLVASEPSDFARAVEAAAGDDGLGRGARARVVERYAWPSRFAQLDALLESL